jgi:hypothetical protein
VNAPVSEAVGSASSPQGDPLAAASAVDVVGTADAAAVATNPDIVATTGEIPVDENVDALAVESASPSQKAATDLDVAIPDAASLSVH